MRGAQTRSVTLVAAWVWYSNDVQLVTGEHTRPVVGVKSAERYSSRAHVSSPPIFAQKRTAASSYQTDRALILLGPNKVILKSKNEMFTVRTLEDCTYWRSESCPALQFVVVMLEQSSWLALNGLKTSPRD